MFFGVLAEPGESGAVVNCEGGNRAQSETAIRGKIDEITKYLIGRASRCNPAASLTARHVAENASYARKVHTDLPYLGGRIDDELWREWVLPYRVLDEDVSLWRKDFHERMQPVIAGTTTVAEAAEAIHDWLLAPGADGARVRFSLRGPNEARRRTPFQVLKAGVGGCGEICMVYVYLLRAVGIPARHCCVGHHTSIDDGHFYVAVGITRPRGRGRSRRPSTNTGRAATRASPETFSSAGIPGRSAVSHARDQTGRPDAAQALLRTGDVG